MTDPKEQHALANLCAHDRTAAFGRWMDDAVDACDDELDPLPLVVLKPVRPPSPEAPSERWKARHVREWRRMSARSKTLPVAPARDGRG